MTESSNSFFIELSSIFDPSGFVSAENKIEQSTDTFSNFFTLLENKSNILEQVFSSCSESATTKSKNAFASFFDITSSRFLDFEVLTEQVLSSISQNIFSSLGDFLGGGITSFLGGGSIFGGLLGSRRTGGAISQTGTYYLHEGEFVLPPEVVEGIKTSTAPNTNNLWGASNQNTAPTNLNITINSPLTLHTKTEVKDVRALCEEISEATRRGVTWAVEQAKISYKIGKQKSSESSL